MSETPNIGLYLEDDASTRFEEWRKKMNGTDDSNMKKKDLGIYVCPVVSYINCL